MKNIVVFMLSKYLWNIEYYIVCNYFYAIYLTVYLYFMYTTIMFPRKSTRDGGKEKRKTTRATLGVRKKS